MFRKTYEGTSGLNTRVQAYHWPVIYPEVVERSVTIVILFRLHTESMNPYWADMLSSVAQLERVHITYGIENYLSCTNPGLTRPSSVSWKAQSRPW
jgi:hypothetical protein